MILPRWSLSGAFLHLGRLLLGLGVGKCRLENLPGTFGVAEDGDAGGKRGLDWAEYHFRIPPL